jgi:probable rRNA maturation factor
MKSPPLERRRVGKAKRAHHPPLNSLPRTGKGREGGGHGAPKSGLPDFGTKNVSKSATADFEKSGLPDFGTKNVSKSATADFDERAFAHPTSDADRSKSEPALAVDVLIEAEAWRRLPQAEDIVRRAIAFAASCPHPTLPRPPFPSLPRKRGRDGWGRHRNAELSVLLCDDKTITCLNGRWRGQEKPTNVLSFPAPLQGATPDENIPLGDIAIAYETLAREAEETGKTVLDHLSHLVVHGFLHLLGYDHHMDDEAERMERMERDILARVGVADPYAAGDAAI